MWKPSRCTRGSALLALLAVQLVGSQVIRGDESSKDSSRGWGGGATWA